MIKKSIKLILFFTLLCGIIYPIFITVIGQIFFNKQANGSIIMLEDGTKVGSKYIGQNFQDLKYFWGRPYIEQFTEESLNNDKIEQIEGQIKEKLRNTSENQKEIPQILYTFSGSGVDPEITSEAALFQIERISKQTNKEIKQIEEIVNKLSKRGIVNVLELNIELEKLQ